MSSEWFEIPSTNKIVAIGGKLYYGPRSERPGKSYELRDGETVLGSVVETQDRWEATIPGNSEKLLREATAKTWVEEQTT